MRRAACGWCSPAPTRHLPSAWPLRVPVTAASPPPARRGASARCSSSTRPTPRTCRPSSSTASTELARRTKKGGGGCRGIRPLPLVGLRSLESATLAQLPERVFEKGLGLLLGAALFHVGEVRLVRLGLRDGRRVVLVAA